MEEFSWKENVKMLSLKSFVDYNDSKQSHQTHIVEKLIGHCAHESFEYKLYIKHKAKPEYQRYGNTKYNW